GGFDDFDRRMMALLLACNHTEKISDWIRGLQNSLPDQAIFPPLVAELGSMQVSQETIDALAVHCSSLGCDEQGELLAVGKHLLEMDDERLQRQLNAISGGWHLFENGLLPLFVHHAPDRAERVMAAGRRLFGDERVCIMLLDLFGDRFESAAAECFRNSPEAFDLGEKLVELNPQRYGPELAERVPKYLSRHGVWNVNWILPHLGEIAVEPFVKVMTADNQDRIDKVNGRVVIENIAKHGGAAAKAALLEVMNHSPQPAIRAAALEQLIAIKDPGLQATLEDAIEKGMTGDARDAVRFAV